MKIAMFHELPKGGAENAVYEIAKQLRERNFLIDLFVTGENKFKNEAIFDKKFFYKFVPKTWQGGNWRLRLYKDTIELLKLYFLHKRIAEDINTSKYDIAFVNASQFTEAPFILRFLKIPSIFYAHDPHYRIIYDPLLKIPENIQVSRRMYEKMNRFLRKIFDRQNFNQANLILANSKYTKRIIKKTYGRESIVAYLGVDTKFYFPIKKEKLYDVLFIGSTAQIDGFRLLLEISKFLPRHIRVRSVLAEVEWISDPSVMRDLYQSSKVLLALAVGEPFGLVPLEAMGCGVPVVAVNEGGYKETVLGDKTGYLIRRSPKNIADKLIELLSNPKKITEMGNDARLHVVKNWTWERSGDRIFSILSNKFLFQNHEM